MSGANTPLSPADARLLLDRTGFGVTAKDLQKLLRKAETRGEAADVVMRFGPSRWKPGGKDLNAMQRSWLRQMAKGRHGLREKQVLFFHDHFATARSGAGSDKRMAVQNVLFRMHALGNFKQLARDICFDVAMMYWLDTVRNHKSQPNENYARENWELFTLGVADLAGNPTYSEADIQTAARAFTGWRVNSKEQPYFSQNRHDYMAEWPERGDKVIFTEHGGFGSGGRSFAAAGEGDTEIDQLMDITFEHTDSDGQSTVARRLTQRLFTFYVGREFEEPTTAEKDAIDSCIAASGFDQNWNLRPLVREVLSSDAFYAANDGSLAAGNTGRVKWPAEFVAGTLRNLGMKPKGREARVDGGRKRTLDRYCEDMGQTLFSPPSVFGWELHEGWISSQNLGGRNVFTSDLIMAREKGATAFRPERLLDPDLTDPTAIVEAVLEILGLAGRFEAGEIAVLVDYLTDGAGAGASVDLNDVAFRHRKLHGLFAVVLQTPQYLIN